MDYIDIIKRAARITWRYKVLWLLGILLALSSGGVGNVGTYNFGGSGDMVPPSLADLPLPSVGVILGVLVVAGCVVLLLAVGLVFVQYIARTGLYRAVDAIAETGAAPTWREGFRLGWSNRAVRMFLLDLVVGLVLGLAALLLLLLAAAPLLLLLFDSDALRALGIATTVGLEILVILLLVVAAIIVGVLQQFWRREIALADRSVGEALTIGARRVWRRAGNVAALWLLLAAIGIGFGLLLVPIALGLVVVAGVIGGGLGYALYALTDSLGWALLFGLPPFLLIVGVPLLIVQGIYLVFEASAWTLAYREVAASTQPMAGEPGLLVAE